MWFLAAFLTKSSYGPQVYAGSAGLPGCAGLFLATICPQSRSMRSTWTRRFANAANDLDGASNDCDGSYIPTSIPRDAKAGSGFALAAKADRTIAIKAMLSLLLDP